MRHRIKPHYWWYPALSFIGWVLGQCIMLLFLSVLAAIVVVAVISLLKL